MSATARLAGFGLILAAVLTAAYGVGAALRSPAASGAPEVRSESDDAAHGGSHGSQADTSAEVLGDLSASDRGYALRLESTGLSAGRSVAVAFTITGPDGRPLRSYDVEHEKQLHLIAVRRDFAGYQHMHPTRDRAGRWSTPLDLEPGSWRLFADFVPGDGGAAEGLTLGVDLEVGGSYAPTPLSAVSAVTNVGEYRVSLDGTPRAGIPTELSFRVDGDGRAVVPEPYLGARGHLVALREGDLAYLHVHPAEDSLSFAATFPTAGRYRLFLDMKVGGEVLTVPFTVEVGA
jgi:hypothetical protein